MTAVIAHALAIIRRDVYGVPCDERVRGCRAVPRQLRDTHGDLPTPIKYHNDLIRDAYKEVEEIACTKLLATLPDELRGAFGAASDRGGPSGTTLVKGGGQASHT